jgi:hypothetical protein
MTGAFTPEECELLAQALTKAWQHLCATGQSRDESLDRVALSRAILKAAELGERSEPVLVAYALAHVAHAKVEILGRMRAIVR